MYLFTFEGVYYKYMFLRGKGDRVTNAKWPNLKLHWQIYTRGGLRGLQPPFQISKIKESNKTKQKIDDNPLEKEEERKSCMFI